MGANEAIVDVEGEDIVPASHKLQLGGVVDVAKDVFPPPGAECTITLVGTVEGLAFAHKGPEEAKEWVRTARIVGTKLKEITFRAPDPEQPRLPDGRDETIGKTVKNITDDLASKRGDKK